jgi:hypothetical protein
MPESAPRPKGEIVTGVTAGLISGAIIEIYAFAVILVMTGGLDVVREYQYTAAAFVGKIALSSTNYAWLGVAAHFAISAAWGAGYVYVAMRAPQLDAQPLIAGVIYGFIVFLLILLFQVAANVQHTPEVSTLGNGIIAHTLFFGVPIALISKAWRKA